MISIETAVYQDIHQARYGMTRVEMRGLAGLSDIVAQIDGSTYYLALGVGAYYQLRQLLELTGIERPAWARLFHPEEDERRRDRGRMGEIRLEGKPIVVILTDKNEGIGFLMANNEVALYRA